MNDTLLCPKEVANLLGISIQTLANWRVEKPTPIPYVKVGKSIRYRLSEVNKYIVKKTIN